MRRTACDEQRVKARGRRAKAGPEARERCEAGRVPVLGTVWAELDERGGIERLHLTDLDPRGRPPPPGALPLGAELRAAFRRWARGEHDAFSRLQLAPAATAFSAAVRRAMLAIPPGQVRTYGEVARAIGRPKATRAVGQACGANPLPVIVPCHRVVAASGQGGFGLGPEAKRKLLRAEGVDAAQPPRAQR
jgi:O-6-methylguanine DNA methyltransferase